VSPLAAVRLSIFGLFKTMLLLFAVVFRGSSEQISSANRLVSALANSVELELSKKRSTQQNRNHVPARSKNSANRTTDGRKPRTELIDVLMNDADACCVGVTLAAHDSSGMLAADIDDCQSKLEHAAVDHCRVTGVPSVKEYSLFDNHFSRTVENVLKNDICVPPHVRHVFTAAAAPAILDEALLAKAPGYRMTTASPCGGGRFLAERPRKYSNDSSSSVSSVRSGCEDSLTAVTRVVPPSTLAPRNTQPPPLTDVAPPRGSPPYHSVHQLTQKVPACAPSPFTDFVYTAAEAAVDSVAGGGGGGSHTALKYYSSPNEPMTLPRISTDLNPYAPDFVFRSTVVQVAPMDGVGCASLSVHPDVSLASSTAAAAAAGTSSSSSSSVFIPTEHLSTGAWSDAAALQERPSVVTTAFNISVPPLLTLDVSPPGQQWTVPTTLLHQSLTFG